jgi:hypothetical protein
MKKLLSFVTDKLLLTQGVYGISLEMFQIHYIPYLIYVTHVVQIDNALLQLKVFLVWYQLVSRKGKKNHLGRRKKKSRTTTRTATFYLRFRNLHLHTCRGPTWSHPVKIQRNSMSSIPKLIPLSIPGVPKALKPERRARKRGFCWLCTHQQSPRHQKRKSSLASRKSITENSGTPLRCACLLKAIAISYIW